MAQGRRTPFGQRMRHARLAKGLTQVEVAKRLGLSQGALSELESKSNTSRHLIDFADLYQCDPHWLAHGTGEPPPEIGIEVRVSQAEFEVIQALRKKPATEQVALLSTLAAEQKPQKTVTHRFGPAPLQDRIWRRRHRRAR